MQANQPVPPYQTHYFRDETVEDVSDGEPAVEPKTAICGRTARGPFEPVEEPDEDDAGACGMCVRIWTGEIEGDDAENDGETQEREQEQAA